MINIDNKYKISETFPPTRVVDTIEFYDYPITTLEQDSTGGFYLSRLIDFDESMDVEQRAVIEISRNRLLELASGNLTLKECFLAAENSAIYLIEYRLSNGNLSSVYFLLPNQSDQSMFDDWDYALEFTVISDTAINDDRLLNISQQKRKVLLDIYIHGASMQSSFKTWAITNLLTPMTNLVADIISDNRKISLATLGYSSPRGGSFGISLEIPIEGINAGLFESNPTFTNIERLISAMDTTNEVDLEYVIGGFKKDKTIEDFKKIINTISSKRVSIRSKIANPSKGLVTTYNLDVGRADRIKDLMDRKADQIEDVDEVVGIIKELDLIKKTPGLTIEVTNEENVKISAYFSKDALDKFTHDNINAGTAEYRFILRRIHDPATSFHKSSTMVFLTDYERIGSNPAEQTSFAG